MKNLISVRFLYIKWYTPLNSCWVQSQILLHTFDYGLSGKSWALLVWLTCLSGCCFQLMFSVVQLGALRVVHCFLWESSSTCLGVSSNLSCLPFYFQCLSIQYVYGHIFGNGIDFNWVHVHACVKEVIPKNLLEWKIAPLLLITYKGTIDTGKEYSKII